MGEDWVEFPDEADQRSEHYVENIADAIDSITIMIRMIINAKSDKIDREQLDELDAYVRRLRNGEAKG